MEERAERPFSRPMVLVDMEGLVSSGVPRAAFALCQLDEDGAPRFTLDVEQIKANGWTFEGDSLRPPKHQPGFAILPPHPYALGPRWVGGNCWTADFAPTVHGTVDHDWCHEDHGRPEYGLPLASKSPWRFVLTTDVEQVAGRAESPLEAARMAEDLALSRGVAHFIRSPQPHGVVASGS